MRKLLLSLACVVFMTGLVIAAEHTIVSFDKETKTLKAKDADGKEVSGKLTDKTKVVIIKGEDKSEGKVEDVAKRWSSDKAVGRKVDITIKDGEITEVIQKAGKKKN